MVSERNLHRAAIQMMTIQNEDKPEFRAGLTHAKTYGIRNIGMFYAASEFTDLLMQQMKTFDAEYTPLLLRDIVETRGATGAIVLGFESFNLPTFMTARQAFTDEETDYFRQTGQLPEAFRHGLPYDQESKVASMWLSWKDTPKGVQSFVAFSIPGADGNWISGNHLSTSHVSNGGMQAAVAFWSILQPNLVTTVEAKSTDGLKPKQVRVEREKGREETITVIRLHHDVKRRMEEVAEGRKKYGLSHQFEVRGHWRQQPYGPGRNLRRPQYIDAFWKGPKGTPMVIKDKVLKWAPKVVGESRS